MVSDPADGTLNMALDEALMRRAGRTGEAVFRVYGWSAPTLSLGRNQRARDCYNLDAAAGRGVGFVRRPTGGRALLHHREVTYSVTMPLASASATGRGGGGRVGRGGREGSAYDFINDILIAALGRMGVVAGRAPEPVSLQPGLRPCFDVPAEHEIVVGGRKLVGSAQWRKGGALLQHGSILVRDDQALIEELLKAALPAPTMAAATLHDVLGRDPTIDEVAEELRRSLADATQAPPRPLQLDDAANANLSALRASYADDAWTWRR